MNLNLNGSFQSFVDALRGFLSSFLSELFNYLTLLIQSITITPLS